MMEEIQVPKSLWRRTLSTNILELWNLVNETSFSIVEPLMF